MIIGADHAHVDFWSMLDLVRDLAAIMSDLGAGLGSGHTPGAAPEPRITGSGLPAVPSSPSTPQPS